MKTVETVYAQYVRKRQQGLKAKVDHYCRYIIAYEPNLPDLRELITRIVDFIDEETSDRKSDE